MSDNLRGHPIQLNDAGEWVYCDTGELTTKTWRDRPCGECGLHFTNEGHDGCLGELPGVLNACCGHGDADAAYVQFKCGGELRESDAIDYFEIMKSDKVGN